MKKFQKKDFFLLLLFLIGFFIAIYPLVSQRYYRIEANKQVNHFEKKASTINSQEMSQRIELAHAYNRTLDPSKLADPYTMEEKDGVKEYARMLELEENIGHVEIPQINEDLPIYAGTSESILQRGAGHLEGTSLPVGGKSTHCVITAHRGLATAKLFRHLDRLKEGDIFYVHNMATVLAYQVDRILTVEPYEFEPILVKNSGDYCTLLTCTPYMINSHRLLVRGHRVAYVAPADAEMMKDVKVSLYYRWYFFFVLLLFGLLFLLEYSRRKWKKGGTTENSK